MNDVIKQTPFKVITTHTSDDDTIRKYLQGKLERTKLTPAVQEQIDHMIACEKLIRKYISRTKVVPMIEKVLNVSQATAYRYYDRTQKLFGETSVKNQNFWIDIQLASLEDDINSARTLKDYRSVAALQKLKTDLIIKTMGSGDALLYDTIQPPPVVIGFFPRSMKVDLPKDRDLKQMVSEKLKQIAEDVEYEEG